MAMNEGADALVRVAVDLPPDIVERIDNLTEAIGKKDWKRKGQSRMATMREFIDRALPEMEKQCGVVPKSGDRFTDEGLDDYEETPEERARIDRMYREAQEREAREREAAGVGDE